jgi:hypothetical protein
VVFWLGAGSIGFVGRLGDVVTGTEAEGAERGVVGGVGVGECEELELRRACGGGCVDQCGQGGDLAGGCAVCPAKAAGLGDVDRQAGGEVRLGEAAAKVVQGVQSGAVYVVVG